MQVCSHCFRVLHESQQSKAKTSASARRLDVANQSAALVAARHGAPKRRARTCVAWASDEREARCQRSFTAPDRLGRGFGQSAQNCGAHRRIALRRIGAVSASILRARERGYSRIESERRFHVCAPLLGHSKSLVATTRLWPWPCVAPENQSEFNPPKSRRLARANPPPRCKRSDLGRESTSKSMAVSTRQRKQAQAFAVGFK